MNFLYAPWRGRYVTDVARARDKNTTADVCVFCEKLRGSDQEHFILGRFAHHAIFLNLFPYNAGHLLIVSQEHKDSLSALSKEARSELIELTNQSITILKDVLGAEGVNVGFNLGRASGAGIPAHLHQHVLPRWVGDTNFLPLLAETKQISVDLQEVYKKLRPHFANLKPA